MSDTIATVIASRAVRAGKEAMFGSWADRVEASARGASGYLASLRLGQTEGLQHLVFRFRGEQAARAWAGGVDYRRLTTEADKFSVGLDQVEVGDPARVELPSDASAAKWKRFVTTWVAVFPILLVVSSVMRLLFKTLPPAVQLVPSSMMLTAMLQWIVLPHIQRWSRAWLLQNANGDLRKG